MGTPREAAFSSLRRIRVWSESRACLPARGNYLLVGSRDYDFSHYSPPTSSYKERTSYNKLQYRLVEQQVKVKERAQRQCANLYSRQLTGPPHGDVLYVPSSPSPSTDLINRQCTNLPMEGTHRLPVELPATDSQRRARYRDGRTRDLTRRGIASRKETQHELPV